ncbi:MAG TPA: hypothetical protein VGW78_06890 [Candidatus Babeliales bacterium]|nr:hypothetical protein [Candidatus Babeliales bacterium]
MKYIIYYGIVNSMLCTFLSYSMEHNYKQHIKTIIDQTYQDVTFITQKIHEAKHALQRQEHMRILPDCITSINRIERNMSQLKDICTEARSDSTLQQNIRAITSDCQSDISQLYTLVISTMKDIDALYTN